MKAKWFNRVRIIGLHGLHQILPALMNLAAAWWVIRNSSEDVWGEFVDPLILAGLGLHILSWGNKEFLLRAFALRPDAIPVLWKQALVARGAILFMIIPLIFLSDWSPEQMTWMLTWIFFGYIRHSFDVVVVYEKDFGKAVLIELGAMVIVFGGLYLSRESIGLTELMRYFALAQIFRAMVYSLIYGKNYLAGPFPQMQFRYFSTALPFFLLGFAGMLVSRTDLYFVAYYMDDTAAGRYQIIINLFTYVQAGAGFLISPFARNIYRLPDKTIVRIALKVSLGGVAAIAVGIPIAYFLLLEGFGFSLPWEYFALGAAAILPVYIYSCFILMLFKHHQQKKVVLANVGAILINIAVNMVLTPRFGLLGALTGSVVCHWFILVMVILYANRERETEQLAESE